MSKIDWEKLDNETIKSLDRFISKYDLEGSGKYVFIGQGFRSAYAFYSTLKQAFEDFIEKEDISGWWSMVDLYGEYVVYKKVESGYLEPLGRIKDIIV